MSGSNPRASIRAEFAGAILAIVLVWLVAYPLALVLIESVHTPSGWSLQAVRQFIEQPSEWKALRASIWISVASVVCAAVIGIPLAFLFSVRQFLARGVLGALVTLPAVLPPLVGVVAFLFLYGESGFISRLVRAALSLEEAPWKLQGAWAILLVHAYSMYVYFYLFTRVGLAAIDPALLEAAASLGANRWMTLRRVVLPLLRPALLGGALLTFMTSLASFSAPYVFGGGYRVMTTQIVTTRLNGDETMAMVETSALTAVALAGLWMFNLARRDDLTRAGSKGRAPEPPRFTSRAAAIAVPAVAWIAALILLLPHIVLIILSLVPVGTWTTQPFPPVYSLVNWKAMVTAPERLRPLLNSVWMATAAMAASVAISLAAALLAGRLSARTRGVLRALLALPWAVPGTVFAIAIASLFSVHAPWFGRVILIGTIWILPLAYLIRSLPVTSRAIDSGILALDPSLEEAAASLGAGRLRILARVTLPLLRPAIVAGGALAFATGLGDFVTSIVLYTYDTRPMALEILSGLRQGDIGESAAFGVLLMIVSAVVFALGNRKETAGA